MEEHVCPICAELTVDEGTNGRAHDALFWEGNCKTWLHRWCDSVTKEQYAVLSASEKPFLCPWCTISAQQAAITFAHKDINSLEECVKSLT